jgi:hypothetical protein
MNLNENTSPDAKNSCMKKTTTNPKVKNDQTNKSLLSAIQHGAKAKAKNSEKLRGENHVSFTNINYPF